MERFKTRERRAVSRDAQILWVAEEMGYSHDKTSSADKADGHEEKLIRLARVPDENTSAYGFMDNQWHRYRLRDSAHSTVNTQASANLAMQMHAKSVAGLSDKVALALWLEARANGIAASPEALVGGALDRIRVRADELASHYSPGILTMFNHRDDYARTPMGEAVLALHDAFDKDPYDIDAMREIALEGAAAGFVMLSEYGRSLEAQGHVSDLPKPGLGSGNIETWE